MNRKVKNSILQFSKVWDGNPAVNYAIDWFNAERFNDMLKANGALLAGGFVLQALEHKGWQTSDMDIYVNKRNASNVIRFMNDIFNRAAEGGVASHPYTKKRVLSHQAPPYDMSFFRKNGILYRIDYHITMSPTYDFNSWEVISKNVDLMIVDDSIELTDVCSNFDLTFCEIWWDGENVNTWSQENMENIIAKKGYLREEYQEFLFKHFNRFIAERIHKYIRRGYSIEFKCESGVLSKAKKHIISPEYYVCFCVTKALYFAVGLRMRRIDPTTRGLEIWIVNNLLNGMTIEMLEKMINKNKFLLKAEFLNDIDIFNGIEGLFKKFCMCTLLVELYSSGTRYAFYRDGEALPILNDFFGVDMREIEELASANRYVEAIRSIIRRTDLYDIELDYLEIIVEELAKRDAIRDITLNYTPALDEINDTCYDFLNSGDESVIELHPIQVRLNEIRDELNAAMSSRNIAEIQRLNKEKIDIMTEHSELLERLNKEQDTSHKDNQEFLSNDETFILVLDSDTLVCYNVEELLKIASNYKNWLLECKGEMIPNTQDRSMNQFSRSGPFYVGITVDETERKAFVDVLEVLKIVQLVRNEGVKIFYVKPKMIHTTSGAPEELYITHTASYTNVFGPADYVSTNHCQAGSSILVYEVFLPQ